MKDKNVIFSPNKVHFVQMEMNTLSTHKWKLHMMNIAAESTVDNANYYNSQSYKKDVVSSHDN